MLLWLVMLGFGGGIVIPAIYRYGWSSVAEWQKQTFNAIYLAQNIGVAVGAAMGGFVAEFSFNYIFLANLIMYVVFALVAVTQFNIEINQKVKYPTHLDTIGKKNKARFISLVLICAMFAICWVAYIQWESNRIIYTIY